MKNNTRIVIVLDRSGSMETCRESTISGLNTFVAEQKKTHDNVSLTLIQFDDNLGKMSYEVVYNSLLSDTPEFTQKDFVPRGGTPLLDAQGKAITELGEELASLSPSERPNKVLFVTITDGHENSSHEFSRSQIKRMIEHQTTKYNWDFVYIGANQDAVAVGQTMGYTQGKSMSYNSQNAVAVANTFTNLSNYTTRASGSLGEDIHKNVFEDEERSGSMVGATK